MKKYKVTNGYTIRDFDTKEEVYTYIKEYLDKQHLTYTKIYDEENDKMRVQVYQYYTLYMETFIIHESMELREPYYEKGGF